METLAALCVGVCLSAACGLRVFVPMLAMGVAARLGMLHPAHGFEWISTWPALVAFGSACVLEVGATLVPWLDHAVDVVATPAAIIAGTLATAAQIDGAGPLVSWATGLAAGGTAAGLVQATSVGTRLASTTTTAGFLNPILNVLHSALAAVMSVLAIAVPIFAGVLLVSLIVLGVVTVRAWRRARAEKLAAPVERAGVISRSAIRFRAA